MVDVAVTQEPADLQELLYAKSKPVLANMLAPELKAGPAKNYKVTKVEHGRGFSLVTVEMTRDPEKDIATVTAEEKRIQTVEYEHHNLQDVVNHFLGGNSIAAEKVPTTLAELNTEIAKHTTKLVFKDADVSFQDNKDNTISLFVKDQLDLRYWGAAHVAFILAEGDDSEVPGKPQVTNVLFNVETNTVTADVKNATEVTITTSTGLSFVAQTNMEQVTYEFAEDLPAGTTITVKAGSSSGNTSVAGVTGLSFNRDTSRLDGRVIGDEKDVTVVTSYGKTLQVTAGTNGDFNVTLTDYALDAFTVTATVVGGKAGVLNVPEKPTTLTDLVYDAVAKTVTGKTNRPAVNIKTDTGVDTNVNVVAGSFSYTFADQLPAGTIITVTAGPISNDVLATDPPFVPTITNVWYDALSGALTGQSNAESVRVTSGEVAENVPVINGYFNYQFIEIIYGGDKIEITAGEAKHVVDVETYLMYVDYNTRDNVVYGQSNGRKIRMVTSTGVDVTVDNNNGNFDHQFSVRLVQDDTVTISTEDKEEVFTIPFYELGDPITDVEFDPLLNSVTARTAAPTVTIRLSSGEVYRDIATVDGKLNYVFPVRLTNGLQIEISEPKGESANGYTNGIASVVNIRYDYRSNQILADLQMANKITITGPFNAAELTAVNGTVGHIPENVLQGGDVVEFKQGEWVQGSYTVEHLNLVYGDDDNSLTDALLTTLGGNLTVQCNVNQGRIRYNYGTVSWTVTGSEFATIDNGGELSIANMPNDGSKLNLTITNVADGHITVANVVVQYSGAAV